MVSTVLVYATIPAAHALFCRTVAGAPSAFVTVSLTISKFYCLFGLVLLLGTLPATAQRHQRAKTSKAKAPAKARTKTAARSRTRTASTSRSRTRTRTKSKEQLELERQANLVRIQEAGKVLTQTTQKKEATLGQLMSSRKS
jgi:hypothetical protein